MGKHSIPLEVRGLSREFGSFRAVDQLRFELPRGRVVGFLGQNGAGKSTTLSMMAGLLRPTEGVIRIEGFRVNHSRSKALSRASFVLERPAFFEYLSGEKNLEIEARLRGCHDAERNRRLLARVGLEEARKRKVKGYSQGMRQRLAFARALVGRPRVLILDEPTTGLDVEGTEQVLDLLRRAATRHGVTVFLSSHHLLEIERICDDVIVIDRGRIVASGPVRELVRGTEVEVLVWFDDTERVASWAKSADFVRVAEVRKGGVAAFHVERKDLHLLLSGLIRSGFAIRDIEVRSQSLKEFFLELMRKGEGNE